MVPSTEYCIPSYNYQFIITEKKNRAQKQGTEDRSMKRQLSFSIIRRNQISSGRELCFLPLETNSGKSVTHKVRMMIEKNYSLMDAQVSRLVSPCLLGDVQGWALQLCPRVKVKKQATNLSGRLVCLTQVYRCCNSLNEHNIFHVIIGQKPLYIDTLIVHLNLMSTNCLHHASI